MILQDIPLFVYGTLRSDGLNARLLVPHIKRKELALAQGRLDRVDYINSEGETAHTVTYCPQGRSWVEGELITLTPTNQLAIWAELDLLELNFDIQNQAPNRARYHFVRQLIRVIPDTGHPCVAWAYILSSKTNYQAVGSLIPDAQGVIRFVSDVETPRHETRSTTNFRAVA